MVSADVGDILLVFYGPTHESKITYEAKVMDIDRDNGLMYMVHYTGWNTRYDEWIGPSRIAENKSSNKAKRLKQTSAPSSSTNNAKTKVKIMLKKTIV